MFKKLGVWKFVCGFSCGVLAVMVGGLCAYNAVNAGTVNGLPKFGSTKEEIITKLEVVKPTYLETATNGDINISDCIVKSVSDFDFDSRDDVSVDISTSVNIDKLTEVVEKIPLGEFEYIDAGLLAQDVKEGTSTSVEDYIKTKYPAKAIAKYYKYLGWSVSYTKGVSTPDMKDYVKIGNKVKVDYSFIDKVIEKLQKKYDTFGDPVKFKTHGGTKITLQTPDSMWGDKIDVKKEKAFLKESLKSGEVIRDRVPEYEQQTGKLGNNYIEVSINQQMVWYVRNGKVKMSSPCVTGTKGSHNTPRGVYYILEKRPQGKWLTGDDYRTWVNRWLRVTWTGIGLHDANWRGSFGGSIYTYSGSHGCINLPFSFVDKLCKKVDCGYPVVIY